MSASTSRSRQRIALDGHDLLRYEPFSEARHRRMMKSEVVTTESVASSPRYSSTQRRPIYNINPVEQLDFEMEVFHKGQQLKRRRNRAKMNTSAARRVEKADDEIPAAYQTSYEGSGYKYQTRKGPRHWSTDSLRKPIQPDYKKIGNSVDDIMLRYEIEASEKRKNALAASPTVNSYEILRIPRRRRRRIPSPSPPRKPRAFGSTLYSTPDTYSSVSYSARPRIKELPLGIPSQRRPNHRYYSSTVSSFGRVNKPVTHHAPTYFPSETHRETTPYVPMYIPPYSSAPREHPSTYKVRNYAVVTESGTDSEDGGGFGTVTVDRTPARSSNKAETQQPAYERPKSTVEPTPRKSDAPVDGGSLKCMRPPIKEMSVSAVESVVEAPAPSAVEEATGDEQVPNSDTPQVPEPLINGEVVSEVAVARMKRDSVGEIAEVVGELNINSDKIDETDETGVESKEALVNGQPDTAEIDEGIWEGTGTFKDERVLLTSKHGYVKWTKPHGSLEVVLKYGDTGEDFVCFVDPEDPGVKIYEVKEDTEVLVVDGKRDPIEEPLGNVEFKSLDGIVLLVLESVEDEDVDRPEVYRMNFELEHN